MEIKSMVKGAAIGMMTGTAVYMISRSPDRKKKMLKKSTGKISPKKTCMFGNA